MIVPLVVFKPLLTLKETSETTTLLSTASCIVPEMVPVLAQVSGNCFTVATSRVSLSVVSVADYLVSR